MAILNIDVKTSGIQQVDTLERKLKGLEKTSSSTSKTTDKLSSTLKVLAGATVAYMAIDKLASSIVSLASGMIETTAKFEQFSTVLETIEGSSQKAQQSMAWIEDFAKTTPFNLDKVTESFVKLRAYGLNPTDGLLRTLGDTASAMGKDVIQAVEAMADAVVGENERLKEFGIKAKLLGEEIRYNWTNSSGEARTALVANNAEIIESTLSAIFNSKYKGAMDKQSKTWNGIVANMQDSWTNFTKNIMNSGLFPYLKSMAIVVGEYLTEGFEMGSKGAFAFSEVAIGAINSVISGLGLLYDAGNTVGLVFDGIVASIGAMVSPLQLGLNIAVKAINLIKDAMDTTSFFTGVSGGTRLTEFTFSSDMFTSGISGIRENWSQIGNGGDLADSFIHDVADVFGQIQFDPGDVVKKDFGDSPSTDNDYQWSASAESDAILGALGEYGSSLSQSELELIKSYRSEDSSIVDLVDYYLQDFNEAVEDAKTELVDFNVETEAVTQNVLETVEAVTQTTDILEDFTDTLYNNNDSVYEAIVETDDSLVDFTESVNNVDYAVDSAITTLDNFIFKFEDTFINSIKNNISSLESIATTATLNTVGYNEALQTAIDVRNDLENNALDIEIGKQFADAYSQFVTSSSSYLADTNQFQSSQDLAFATATVGTQTGQFQDTAVKTVGVLESMNGFLETINQAFEDGILTDEEKLTISGVATTVNAKNETLLNSESAIVGATTGVSTTVGSQVYYDNTGLMKDDTFGLVDVSSLYTGGSIKAEVNTISGFATSTDVGAVSTTVGNQTYYNNSGLMKDNTFDLVDVSSLYTGGTINAEVNTADVSKLALDSTFTTSDGLKVDNAVADVSSLYTGGSIKAEVNTISGFATSTDIGVVKGVVSGDKNSLTGALGLANTLLGGDKNSVTSALGSVNTLLGGKTTASATNSISQAMNLLVGDDGDITIGSLATGVSFLSTATELDLENISTYTKGTEENTSPQLMKRIDYATTFSNYDRVNYMDTPTVKKEKENYYYEDTPVSGTLKSKEIVYEPSAYSTDHRGKIYNITEWRVDDINYKYYAKGGFTGLGRGLPDQTGEKQAGIVHENEWVAPKWMIQSNGQLFQQLESARQRGNFAGGGYATPITATSSANNNDIQMAILEKLDSMNEIFKRVTQGGEMMQVELTA